jgi:hypothetical protein
MSHGRHGTVEPIIYTSIHALLYIFSLIAWQLQPIANAGRQPKVPIDQLLIHQDHGHGQRTEGDHGSRLALEID